MFTGLKNATRRLFARWRGSTLQFIAVVILPLTILLVAISFGSFFIHQNAMRSMVGERDKRSVQASANAIETELRHRVDTIQTLALLARPASASPSPNPDTILSEAKYLTENFDAGVAFFDKNGDLRASVGAQTFWRSLPEKAEFASMLQNKSSVSSALVNPQDGKLLILISSYDDNLVVIGALTAENLVQNILQNNFSSDMHTAIYMISPDYRVLYQNGPHSIEGEPAKHPGVADAFLKKSGTTYVQVGNDEHVVAYSLISSLNWAIVTEESWEMVANPTLETSQITPLVLVPALLLAVLALWFGAVQIVKPLQALEAKAAKLAWGDFKEIEGPVYGIAEIRHLQTELIHMAHQLQAAQDSLHSYIGAITKGQEDERLRLAHDLHDDTIQALIALKQRVQLAKMNLSKDASPKALIELEALAEQTIENLRRTTRALRPIYLEDLGLLAALEMLAGETSQSAHLRVDFRYTGVERRLPADVELALYRIAQESLNNMARHAQATYASVQFEFKPQSITLQIMDNGAGFVVPKSPAAFVSGGHFGLIGLYERAQLIGAQLEITSTLGKGTEVEIYLPTFVGSQKKKENIMVTDPFCGMQVDPNKTPHHAVYQGQTYHFCAAVCKEMFEQAPQKYVALTLPNEEVPLRQK